MQVRTRRVTAASGMEIASDSPSRAIAEFWGRKGSGGSGLSLRFDRRYPDNEQRIATPVCVEKWPEANERDPAYHRKAETIPRGGGSFFIECSGACHLYRVPEIVTRGRFPDGGESDSTWRTPEARHVGSDTIAPGF
jgi:hypothetical protein